jgi:DNA-binding NtrC family response regulator
LRECRAAAGSGPRPGARLIASTNRIVKAALAKGAFDKGLHDCLAEGFIQMPPLKDRKEDICLLINHFLDQFNAKSGRKVLAVGPEAMDYLLSYNWPGNVIQLENVIERAFALGVELVIQIEDLPAEIKTAGEIARMH